MRSWRPWLRGTALGFRYAIGVLGFFMRRFDFPVFGAFLDRPFAVVVLVLAIAALVLPAAVGTVRRVRGLGEED